MRYLRAAAAGGALLLILGGIPLVLIAAAGDPRSGWVAVGVGDVSDTALLDVLASLGWLAWAYAAGTVLAEIVQLARTPGGRSAPHRMPGPGRHLARTLLTAVVLALPLAGPAQAFAAAHPPAAIPAATALPAHRTGVPLVPAGALGPGGAGDPARASMATAAPMTPVPADGPTTARPPAGGVREYVITRHGPGTFWDLAQTYLGDGQRWQEIWDLNEGRSQADGAHLRSPGLLRTGWTVLLPASSTAEAAPARAAVSAETGARLAYVVQQGDRLGAIAERFLGGFSAYPQIRDANAALMPAAAGADHIEPGWHLRLPEAARDRGRLPHATGHAAHHRPAPPDRSSSFLAAPPSPGPSGAAPTPRPAGPLPGSSPSGNDVASSPGRTEPGIAIPGGWMDLPLAVALVGLAAAVWIRRRMVYLYPPSEEDSGDQRDDEDLEALPAVVTRLRHAVREHARRLPEAFPDPREPGRRESSPTGDNADRISIGAVEPSPEGVGLTGDGALAAGRAFLVATLTAHVRGTSPGSGVLVTRTALNSLLPNWDVPEGRFGDHLMIGADHDETLALHHARRARSDRPATPVLLITELPPANEQTRLAEAFQAAAVHAVVLGDWAPGPTLTLDSSGRIASGVSRFPDRVAVLDEPAAVALLQVLQQASPPRRQPPRPLPAATDEKTPPPNPSAPDMRRSAPDRSGATDSGEAPGESTRSGARPVQVETSSGRVAVSLLGRPTVVGRHGTPVGGLRRHATELLVYLAVHRKGAQLAQIMEALWPDATLRRAQQRLSTETANLRRTIRSAAGDPALQPVVNTGGHYHLDPGILDLDLWRFLDHLDAASATTDPQLRASELRAALATSPGILAENCDYGWIDPAREHLRRRSIQALLALADHPDAGPRDVAALTTQAADLDPASEDLAQRNMRALATIGHSEAIGKRLDRLRRVLNDIDEEPSPETVTLAAELAATTSRVLR